MSQQDINIEYERIFGVVHYPNLFNIEDLEYNELRKEIIDAPLVSISNSPKNLPFENILDFSDEIGYYQGCSKQDGCDVDIYDIVVGIRNHAIKTIVGILSVLSESKQPLEPPLVCNLSKK